MGEGQDNIYQSLSLKLFVFKTTGDGGWYTGSAVESILLSLRT